MELKCLHICNDLMGSMVHQNLYNHLMKLKIDQHIYYPVRKQTKNRINDFNNKSSLNIIYSKQLKNSHRFLFRNKIKFLYKDIQRKTNLTDYEIVHATTLFSDGPLALNIFKDYGIPYIVAVRGTDINLFLRYRIDLFPLAKEILENASKIIFISQSLERNFFEHYLIRTLNSKSLKNKSKLICNGLDSFWLNNINNKTHLYPNNILYIGRFDHNKNVLALVKAVLRVKKTHPNLQINLVGTGGKEEKKIISMAEKYRGTINYKGPIFDKELLKKYYLSNHIFSMASYSETFGLVYLEALSQGLPVLYSKNQGIDGTFKELVGEAVNPSSVKSIAKGLTKIIKDYNRYEISEIDFSRFSWEKIAEIYKDIYSSISLS